MLEKHLELYNKLDEEQLKVFYELDRVYEPCR